jgi:hypothetical protein
VSDTGINDDTLAESVEQKQEEEKVFEEPFLATRHHRLQIRQKLFQMQVSEISLSKSGISKCTCSEHLNRRDIVSLDQTNALPKKRHECLCPHQPESGLPASFPTDYCRNDDDRKST